ncbi:BPSS1780 family membrane protein [Comamonas serinivorans]|nr:BPSS1780 family membrane protein [Comamonas serinivorans]
MTYRTVPVRQGLYWLREGAVGFFRRPMALGSLFLLGFMGLMLLAALPLVGLPLSLMLTPCVSFGLLAAVGELRGGRAPSPALLIEGLRGAPVRRRNMLRLGLLYGAIMLTWTVLWLSGLDWNALMSADGTPNVEAIRGNSQLLTAVLMVGVGNVPLLMVFMHAAALVYWNQSPTLQALGTSAMAMVRSLPAYLLWLLCLFMAFSALGSLLQFILVMVGGAGLVVPVTFAIWAAVSCVGLGGMFQAFLDCHPPSTPRPG